MLDLTLVSLLVIAVLLVVIHSRLLGAYRAERIQCEERVIELASSVEALSDRTHERVQTTILAIDKTKQRSRLTTKALLKMLSENSNLSAVSESRPRILFRSTAVQSFVPSLPARELFIEKAEPKAVFAGRKKEAIGLYVIIGAATYASNVARFSRRRIGSADRIEQLLRMFEPAKRMRHSNSIN